MMFANLLFYMFSAVLLASAVMVIAAKNPVHSVLFLILAFFNAAGLFLLLGAEFVAFILVIVYVGAVAVLFLFVVMMLDINFKDIRKGMAAALPVGLLVGIVLLAQLATTAFSWQALPEAHKNILSPQNALRIEDQNGKYMGSLGVDDAPPQGMSSISNTHALGQVLYTDYVYPFQVSGLILLVAMIGAITLTLRDRGGVRRQNIAAQITRQRADVLKIVKVEKGRGIS